MALMVLWYASFSKSIMFILCSDNTCLNTKGISIIDRNYNNTMYYL